MIGDGPIGQLAAQLANIAGASKVIMAGSWDEEAGHRQGVRHPRDHQLPQGGRGAAGEGADGSRP